MTTCFLIIVLAGLRNETELVGLVTIVGDESVCVCVCVCVYVCVCVCGWVGGWLGRCGYGCVSHLGK